MKSTELLSFEHQLILRANKIAQAMAQKFTESQSVEVADLNLWMSFVKNYADTFHHMKEEDVLFEWMQEQGMPCEGGPIFMMLEEHNIGRRIMSDLNGEIARGEFNTACLTRMAGLVDSFADLLATHIYKEDNILYKMAEQMAGTKGDAEILARFEKKFTAEQMHAIQRQHEEMVAQLEKKYGTAH